MLPKFWKENIKNYIRRFNRVIFREDSKLGKLLLDDIKLVTGVNRDCNIKFVIDKTPINIPEELSQIANRLKEENTERMKKGENPVYTDLFPYAVHEILPDREPYAVHEIVPYREGPNEKPECTVRIRESSYFNSLITIMALDEKIGDTTVKEKYYSQLIANPGGASPDGYDIVHGFGLNTMVITKDRSFVFAKRNRNTVSTAKGSLHMSVGEHLNNDVLDYAKNSEPSAIESIVKGIYQELGVVVSDEDKANIRFYAVGFSKSVCQYGVLGFTYLRNTSNMDIWKSWELSKDGRYESEEIIFIDANIKSIVDYLNNTPNVTITKFALLNVCLALMLEPELGQISQTKIEKELGRLRLDALVE